MSRRWPHLLAILAIAKLAEGVASEIRADRRAQEAYRGGVA